MPLPRILLCTLGLAFGLSSSGIAAAQDALSTEAEELQSALENVDQSYEYLGLQSGHGSARVGGSRYTDPATARSRPPARTTLPAEVLPPKKTHPSP